MRKKGNTSGVNHLGMTRRGEFCAENGKLSTKPGCLSSFLLIEDFQELFNSEEMAVPSTDCFVRNRRLKAGSFNPILGILGGCFSSFLNDGFHYPTDNPKASRFYFNGKDD